MADVEILAQQVEPAPLNYAIPGGQEILLKCLAAAFDGSAAAVAWQPAIQVVGPSGQVLRTFPLSQAVAAGASADVTWFPRSGGGIGGAGAGIRYDLSPQVGDWLEVSTSGVGPSGNAFDFEAAVGGFNFGTANGPFGVFPTGELDMEPSGDAVIRAGGEVNLNSTDLMQLNSGGGIEGSEGGGVGITFTTNGPASMTATGADPLTLEQSGSGDVAITSDGGSLIAEGRTDATFAAQLGRATLRSVVSDVQVLAGTSIVIDTATEPILLSARGGTTEATILAKISAGNYFVVSDFTPNERFRVQSDGKIAMPSLPTSAAGLASGFLWNNAGVVNIVP